MSETNKDPSELSNELTSIDIFRDTPVRYLGYANEVGEAFRSVISVKLVWSSYGVASLYVLADTLSKTASIWQQQPKEVRTKEALKVGGDVLLWQTLASVIIPGLTINRICAASRYFLQRSPLARVSKPLTVALGLGSIPLIIRPIDNGVDHVMDRTVRKYLAQI